MQKEATARLKINKLLTDAKWRFFESPAGSANISLENNVKLSQKDLDEYGNNFDKIQNGFIDFLLQDSKGFPLVILEAKSEDKDPLDGKEQARRYAQSQNVRFVILSNGNLHYFWDLKYGNPTIITTFPTQESLTSFHTFQPSPEKLADENIESDYIVKTQNSNYQNDPRWQNEKERKSFLDEQGLKFLREYQIRAVKALQESAKKGNNRYLFEMATGTGKTLVSAAVIKLFLKTGNAKRILFLVDRLELEDQAWKNFVKYLKNDFTCVIYKENKDDWKKAEIVVSTVQSLMFNNKFQKLFSPTDFELIVSDESHRSISGNARAVFEYFVGYKLGLTATPKDYLKRIDVQKIGQQDPRAWERRQLLDTYKTFGCEKSEPTFRYSLVDGVKDGFLVNPIVTDARTEITTELLSEQGYAIKVKNEDGVEEEEIYYQTDFEKKFFSDKTNHIFCKTFLDNAIKDPISGEIGKSIIYCVSQKHASKITQILNELALQKWPGKYNSDFAIQVTSNIPNSQQFAISFVNNNLNGHSKFIEGYKSSKARVCVTVSMMTTGYDCQDILNLGLMRPIFSPTDFIQIKGRGTRKYTFNFKSKEDGQIEVIQKEKDRFKLFDFFANCEYFEEKFDYDETIELPIYRKGTGGPPGPTTLHDVTTVYNPDPLKTLKETVIGVEGMKVDRKIFEKFEETIKQDQFVQEQYKKGNFTALEGYIKEKIFDKPEDYFNLERLRKSVKVDRRISLREFIEKIFGGITGFKSKDELLEEEFGKFISINKLDNKYLMPAKNYFKAYITDDEFRKHIDDEDFQYLYTYPGFSMDEFKELNGYREIVPEYIKDYVSLNTYI
ncbi:MAG: Type III restriction protein res subunit [Candidatus Roizmanbacteria bacterium GW2011_GWA2_32_13]|uniref:Type III restriction protein res subunit n=1 Tax=Candidatus Roizmanbacteria bacterium GW2011_GWA2_32_13 TaxID=1618475 RepID=A0A0G0B3K1_9BACT|nr:MAG: Type III restriction protein res subunit [Candidatus Roizmanbacteria bacterium GW2011_GWA2_32_13]